MCYGKTPLTLAHARHTLLAIPALRIFDFSRDTIVDQILRFEFSKFRIGLGKQLQRALYAVLGRNDAAIVKQPHPIVQVFAAVRWREPQPSFQTTDNRRLITFVLNKSVRSDQASENLFYGIWRAVDITSAGYQAGSLVFDIERRQFHQDAAALLCDDSAIGISQHRSIDDPGHHSLRQNGVVTDGAN